MELKTRECTMRFLEVRKRTEALCAPLQTEDYIPQPVVDVSPPKWHLGHTTWFFEEFILSKVAGYNRFNSEFAYVFNSYYESLGARVIRTNRGNLSRPTVDEVYAYRRHVDNHMTKWLDGHELTSQEMQVLQVGLNHEQQHQELLLTDIKYILGHNPLFPAYGDFKEFEAAKGTSSYLDIPSGTYPIGYHGDGFCFDNELSRHRVYLEGFSIAPRLVTNAEYIDFIRDGGYNDFQFWHAEGWDWIRNEQIEAPLYWHKVDGSWMHYTLQGLQILDPDAPISHISWYEAAAFAAWKGERLPTEFEWEVASPHMEHGLRWEWTNSAYLPYPGYQKAPGALGEYNGKFMINQMVLRGGSVATPPGHIRPTYRNFFHPNLQWQYSGIRLVKNK
jgi:ergothioneine biosynthesis protein EgtB